MSMIIPPVKSPNIRRGFTFSLNMIRFSTLFIRDVQAINDVMQTKRPIKWKVDSLRKLFKKLEHETCIVLN